MEGRWFTEAGVTVLEGWVRFWGGEEGRVKVWGRLNREGGEEWRGSR
ncbi:uncharacterized protein G2W53_014224 [Senna tora]|uniref:Uncharacterized protein n=1 Tax=Senna tora TaxID=362788 RepID=A0A834WT27_9FABA|nr:uncharacterized protein G2W53_014224 [Senna tora]